MSTIDFRLRYTQGPEGANAAVAEVTGTIDAATAAPFQSVMDKLFADGVRRLVLNLQDVSYVNSTGLGMLLKYVDQFQQAGGALVICRVPMKVMVVIKTLGFDALLAMEEEEEAALARVRAAAPAATIEIIKPTGGAEAALAPAAPRAEPSVSLAEKPPPARPLDKLFGQVAVWLGLATPEDVTRALEEQKSAARAPKIGRFLVKAGAMGNAGVRLALSIQRSIRRAAGTAPSGKRAPAKKKSPKKKSPRAAGRKPAKKKAGKQAGGGKAKPRRAARADAAHSSSTASTR